MKSHFPKVRRRIHRAFFDWYAKNHEQFPLPLQYVGRKDNCLQIGIPGLHPAISIILTWEIVASVEWQGDCWDLLTCFEAIPQHSARGYTCALCDQQARIHFATREALWQDHLFMPFLNWLNDTLLPAKWIGLYGSYEHGVTWVELITEPNPKPNAIAVLLLWLPDSGDPHCQAASRASLPKN